MPDYAEAAIMTSLNIDSRYRIQSARDYMHALHGDSFQPTEWTVETTLFEQDELEQKHKFFSKKRILLLIAICLAIVASGMVAAIKLRKNTDVVVTNNKELPDLKGMTEEEAMNQLQTLDLSDIKIVYIYDADGKETVEEQNPAAGGNIVAQSEITLTVKSAKKTVLPELQNSMTYSAAKDELQKKGLIVEKKEKYDENISKGNVIDYEKMAAGEVLDAGTLIQLNISLGSKKDYEIKVPDLSGLTIKEAEKICKKSKIPYKIAKGTKQEYIVQTQSVQANKTINVREEVLRIFGKKKEIKVVKREPVKQKKTPTDKKQEKEMARIAE